MLFKSMVTKLNLIMVISIIFISLDHLVINHKHIILIFILFVTKLFHHILLIICKIVDGNFVARWAKGTADLEIRTSDLMSSVTNIQITYAKLEKNEVITTKQLEAKIAALEARIAALEAK